MAHDLSMIAPDEASQTFWRGCCDEKLLLQYSPKYDRYQFYPRPMLTGTSDDQLEWREASGDAEVYALALVEHNLVTDAPPAPYLVALVKLAEGPVMMTNIEAPADMLTDIRIGQPVALRWRSRGDAPPLPVFSPIGL